MRIISAIAPWRHENSYTEIFIRVWFTEYSEPFDNYLASCFDCEAHGRELWFRAMKGEYGEIEVRSDPPSPMSAQILPELPFRLLPYYPAGSSSP